MPKKKKAPLVADDEAPPTEHVFSPSALERFPEHARLIALVIAEYSAIEYGLVMLLATTLETASDVVFPMVYAAGSGKARLDVMRAAFSRLLSEGDRLDQIKQALTDCEKRLKARNNYAHAHFDTSVDGSALVLTMPTRVGTLLPFSNEIRTQELQTEFRKMKALDHRVWQLVTLALAAPHPTPRQ